MIPEPTRRAGLHPSLVLSAYVEPLCRGRRVAILGDATVGLAEELARRGARLVHAYDPDRVRTAEAIARATPGRGAQVTYAVFTDDLGVRDGAFDVVILPDLTLFPDPGDALRRTRRLTAPTGAAVIVAPNTKVDKPRLITKDRDAATTRGAPPPGYYELFDLVSLQFAKVRMIGQAPFVGYTVADFAPRGEPSVSVDTSLLDASEEPEFFIAIASDRSLMLDPYAVIELPWVDVAATLASSPAETEARTEERLALTEAQTRLALITAELEKVRDRQQSDTRDVEGRAAAAAALSARVLELELEVSTRDARIKEIESRAGDNHVRAERLAQQVRELEEELRRQRDRGFKLTKQLEEEKKTRTRVEIELGMLRGRPDMPGARERIDVLSSELDAARSRINELELEHAETRRQGVGSMPLPPATTPPDPGLMDRLAEVEIALHATRRELSAITEERDAAIERARRAEVKASRADALEVELGETRAARTNLEQRIAEARRRIADLEQRLADEQHKVADLESRLADARRKLADLEKRLAAGEPQRVDLEASLARAEQRIAELEEQTGAAEAASAEIAALEAALRDRGHVVAALTRDLRESERVGKELLEELEALRSSKAEAAPSSGGGGGGGELRARLDALAASAARSEADLQAANWRVAQLERELADAKGGPREPDAVALELEQALAAARAEVASLRAALAAQGEQRPAP